MPSEKVTFSNSNGHDLSGRLETPAFQPKAYALFAHCFSCSKDIAAATRVSRSLCDHGIGVLRFDFTGLGNSEGDFSSTNFSSNLKDLFAASEFLNKYYKAPELLIGHSLGGAAVLMAASKLEKAKAVATIGAPSDPAHIQHLFQTEMDKIETQGKASVQIAGRTFEIQKQFIDDLKEQKLTTHLSKLKKPLLVFHSPLDKVVSIEHARELYETASHPKSFISLDQADHLLSHRKDSEFVANTLAAWSSHYLNNEIQSKNSLKEGKVSVEETDGKFGQNIQAGKHKLYADEPVSMGGQDAGPSPYDFLLAGLGACTSMTIRMYAEHKKIPLEHVSVLLSHQKIHANDCESCETQSGKIDLIERKIDLKGKLSQEQKEKLLKIADRCPVHRTLHSEIKIKTQHKKKETDYE